MIVRDATASDFADLLRLNEESVHFLSPLSPARLEALFDEAAYCRVVEDDDAVCGFLLALGEGSRYDSPNYLWFAGRFDRFLYIDRVVVSAAHQGRGIGKRLYDDLFAFARQAGIPRLTCEFDIEPPNEASRRFHQRYGFSELGTQAVADGKKRVSLQAVSLPDEPLSSTLPGTWRLVSRVDLTEDGRRSIEPSLGEDPVALLFYDRAGNFAAQFMKRDRTGHIPAAATSGHNNSRAQGGYDAYFGTYTIDDAAGTVTQTLLGSLSNENVGMVLTRGMSVAGESLAIEVRTTSSDGEPVTRTLTWRRVG